MKIKNIFLLTIMILIASCSVEQEGLITPPELQKNEVTDHMSVIGNTNQFLEVVGTDSNVDVIAYDINYFGESNGYLVRPDDEESYPGIVLIHEWWGLNEHIKEVAQTLAKEGYVVIAVDLYNGEVAENSSQARVLRTSIDQNESIMNMKAAVDYLKNDEKISKVASMGFCFGGEQSAKLSMSDVDLDATVIYYGSLPQEVDEIKNIDAPVLGIFGELDTGITPETVRVFEEGLNEIGYTNDIKIYDGVGHAFVNPSGSRFGENETRDAWNRTLDFLNTNLN